MHGFTAEEMKLLRGMATPRKIQDYLESLPYSFDIGRDMLRSPRRVLRERSAHCIEGALLGAAALYVHGQRPLLLDLRSTPNDLDHVVTLFQVGKFWGALSKTNHVVLRYREPVYRSVRELAMSYFHEYFLDTGEKTMIDYSDPFDVVRRCGTDWLTSEEDIWYVAEKLDESRHRAIATARQRRVFRRADAIEISAGKLLVYPKPEK